MANAQPSRTRRNNRMIDFYVKRSWMRLATGLLALAIIAAIWINWRFF
jgi:hypothetical protein